MVPVGPCRCLAMMRSALLCASSIARCHCACASSNFEARSDSSRPSKPVGLGWRWLQVVVVAVDEHHHVGVLLDRAGFAEVRELRPLVLALLDRAGELRQRHDRHRELLGDGLQPLGDHGDLQHAAVRPGAGGGAHELEVVHHDELQPPGPLQPAAAGAQRGDGDGRGVVDHQRQAGELAADLDEAVEIPLLDVAAADLVAGDARVLGQQAGGELVGAHLEREDGDGAARLHPLPLLVGFAQQGLGGAEGDLRGERGLAHAGAAGEDQQIRAMQAAGLGIEVAQAGGEAGDAAGGGEGAAGGHDRLGQRLLEGDEAALGAAVLGEVEESLLGGLELHLGVELGLGAEGAVHHLLADVDQLAAQPAVVDHAAVFAGVDDADHRREQLGQVGRAADLVQQAGMLEFRAQGDDVGELAGLAAALDGAVDAAVHRIGEMFRREEFGDPFIGLVVGQQGAEQRLFRLLVLRWHALRQAAAGIQEGGGRVDGVHARHSSLSGACGLRGWLWITGRKPLPPAAWPGRHGAASAGRQPRPPFQRAPQQRRQRQGQPAQCRHRPEAAAAIGGIQRAAAQRQQPGGEADADRGMQRLRRRRLARRHAAQHPHGAEMHAAEGQRMQQLHHRERRQPGGLGQHRPAHHPGQRGDRGQPGRAQPVGQRPAPEEEGDLDHHALAPQQADDRGREAGGGPVQGAEAVVQGVAALDQRRERQQPAEGRVGEGGEEAGAAAAGGGQGGQAARRQGRRRKAAAASQMTATGPAHCTATPAAMAATM